MNTTGEYELAYQAILKDGRLEWRRKSFKTAGARQAFTDKLEDRGTVNEIRTRDPVATNEKGN